MSRQTLTFDDTRVPPNLSRLPRVRENRLRLYYADGKAIKIKRDNNEPHYAYEMRASFVLARSGGKERLEELIVNSRIAVNKKWAPLVDDEEGKKVQSPAYPDEVEERYQKISGLLAHDAVVDKVVTYETTIYYEPEKEVGEGKVEVGKEEENGEEGGGEVQGEEEEGGEGKEVEIPDTSMPSSKLVKEDKKYILTNTYPLHGATPEDERRSIVRRLVQIRNNKERDEILGPVFAIYTSRLVGSLGNTSVEIDIEDGSVVFVTTYTTEKAANQATERIDNVIASLPSISLKRGNVTTKLYYTVTDKSVQGTLA